MVRRFNGDEFFPEVFGVDFLSGLEALLRTAHSHESFHEEPIGKSLGCRSLYVWLQQIVFNFVCWVLYFNHLLLLLRTQLPRLLQFDETHGVFLSMAVNSFVRGLHDLLCPESLSALFSQMRLADFLHEASLRWLRSGVVAPMHHLHQWRSTYYPIQRTHAH